jgi:hypothetical protein
LSPLLQLLLFIIVSVVLVVLFHCSIVHCSVALLSPLLHCSIVLLLHCSVVLIVPVVLFLLTLGCCCHCLLHCSSWF